MHFQVVILFIVLFVVNCEEKVNQRWITTRTNKTFVVTDPIRTNITRLSVCFIYESSINLFSYDYNQDLARLEIRNSIREIATTYVENVGGDDVEDIVNVWADSSICDVFIGTGNSHIPKFALLAKKYPKIYFLGVNARMNESNTRNIVIMHYEYRFALGYIAGRMSVTGEACFISGPFEYTNHIRVSANTLLVGMRLGRLAAGFSENVTLHVIPTERWFNQTLCEEAWRICKEQTNADVLVENLCSLQLQGRLKDEIFFRDSRFIGGMSVENQMRLFIGETVFTSALSNWTIPYQDAILEILNGTFRGNLSLYYGNVNGSISFTEFSDQITWSIIHDMKTTFYEKTKNYNLPCEPEFGDLYRIDGKCFTPDQYFSIRVETFPWNPTSGGVIVHRVELANPVITLLYTGWGTPLGIICAGLAVIGLLYSIVLLFFTIIYHKHPAISRIQVPFCIITQIGGILGYVFLLLLPGMPNQMNCAARPWVMGMAFVLIYLPLLLKATVIRYVLRLSRKPKKTARIKMNHLASALTFFIILEIVINVLWNVLSIGQVETNSTNNPNNDYELAVYCTSGKYSNIFLSISLITKIIVLLYGCFLAWDMRGLKKIAGKKLNSYSESQEIFWIIYTIFLLSIFCVIATILLDISTAPKSTTDAFLMITVWVVVTCTLTILFPRRIFMAYRLTIEEYKQKYSDVGTETSSPTAASSQTVG